VNLVNNALSDRQMSALRVRADFKGPASGPLRQGVSDASGWLAERLADNVDNRTQLRAALSYRVRQGIVWDAGDFASGWACVLDDVAAILDDDRDTINDLLRPTRTP
jgi:hypothetical protein